MTAKSSALTRVQRHPLVVAWSEVAEQELCVQGGDLSGYLLHAESAYEHFVFAGDVRNGCAQQHNLADAYMRFGAYKRAVATFREVLETARPMDLNIASCAMANLAFALSRQGELKLAEEMALSALAMTTKQGNRRFRAFSAAYLALVRALLGDLDGARSAIELALKHADARALVFSRGVATGVLLLQDDAAGALSLAEEGMQALEELGGMHQGEAVLRMMHATALRHAGESGRALAAIQEARTQLISRAACINDTTWRELFLSEVPEHRQTLALAAAWLAAADDANSLSTNRMKLSTMVGLGRDPSLPGVD